jgi:hypothetical protein
MLTAFESSMPFAAATRLVLIACVPLWEMRLVGREAYAGPWVVQPHAVGTDQHRVGLARDADDCVLELLAQVFAGLGEAGGEHAHAAHALGRGVLHHARRHLAWHGAQHVVHVAGDLDEALEVGNAQLLDAGDLVRVDLHGVDGAVEGAHVAQPLVSGHLLVTDNGHAPWVERALQPRNRIAHAGTSAVGASTTRASTASAPSG